MKLSHKIKLFIAKHRGQVAKSRPVDETWKTILAEKPVVEKPVVEKPLPLPAKPIDSGLDLFTYLRERQAYLEGLETVDPVIDEEYQQIIKIKEVLWPLIKTSPK